LFIELFKLHMRNIYIPTPQLNCELVNIGD